MQNEVCQAQKLWNINIDVDMISEAISRGPIDIVGGKLQVNFSDGKTIALRLHKAVSRILPDDLVLILFVVSLQHHRLHLLSEMAADCLLPYRPHPAQF